MVKTLTDWNTVMEYYHSPDEEKQAIARASAIQLLNNFIWDTMWRNYHTYAPNYKDELYDEGVLGVLMGLKNFDLSKGAPTTHFYTYIIDRMGKFVSEYVRGASSYFLERIRMIEKAIERFDAEEISYNEDSLAVATGLDIITVQNCLAIKYGTESPVAFDVEEYTTAHGSQQLTKSAEETYMESQTRVMLEEALAKLDSQTAIFIQLVTPGWYAPYQLKHILGTEAKGQKATKKEISRAFGMSESEVAKIIRKGYAQLKKILTPVKKPQKVLNDAQIILVPQKINLDDMDILS